MKCQQCGASVRDGAKYCQRCGAPMDHRETVPVTAPVGDKPSEKRSRFTRKRILVILAIAVAAAAIVAGVLTAVFVLSPKPRQEETLTVERAYQQYEDMLDKAEDSIQAYAGETKQKNVALYDLNRSGIPDLLYIGRETVDGKTVNRVHIVVDEDNKLCERTNHQDTVKDFVLYQKTGDSVLQLVDIQKGCRCPVNGYAVKQGWQCGKQSAFQKEEAPAVVVFYTCYADKLNTLFRQIDGNMALTCQEAKRCIQNRRLPQVSDYSNTEKTTAAKTTAAVTTKPTAPTTVPVTTKPVQPTTVPVTTKPAESTTAPQPAESYLTFYRQGTYYNNLRKSEESYAMPLFQLSSDSVNAANEALKAQYESCLSDIYVYETQPFSDGVYRVSYQAWRNGSVVSLCVEMKMGSGVYRYAVYSVDVNSGKVLDNNGIAAYLGTTMDALQPSVRLAMENGYRERFASFADANSKRYQMTMADDNVHAARLFLRDNNELCVAFTCYYEAQAGESQSIAVVYTNS